MCILHESVSVNKINIDLLYLNTVKREYKRDLPFFYILLM